MWQLQSFIVDPLVFAVEQIDINGSRGVPWMIPFAAQRFLDLNQLLKQPHGIAFILKLNDSIQKFSGSDRKSTRLNSSHTVISYAVFCLKKKKKKQKKIKNTQQQYNY